MTMERAGIAVDLQRLHGLQDAFDAQIAEVTPRRTRWRAASSISARPSNCRRSCSPSGGAAQDQADQDQGYTTDAEALSTLYAKTQDPLLECLLIWRDKSKLRQTVAGLIPRADEAGRIHDRPQPDRRCHGQVVQYGPQPPEHPGADRGGPADPGGVRRRRGLTRAC